MKSLVMVLLVAFLALPAVAVAQSQPTSAPAAAAVSSPAPVLSATPAPNKVIATLQAVDSKVPGAVAGWVLAVLAFIVEMLMRFIPTAQPRSLFILVSNALKIVADIFTKVSTLLDNVVQNIKDPSNPTPPANS